MGHRSALGLVVLLAASACGGSAATQTTTPQPTGATGSANAPTPVAANPGDCSAAVATAIDGMVAQSQQDLASATPEQRQTVEATLGAVVPKLKTVTSEVCVADKWSAEMVKCVGDSKTGDDFDKCATLLTDAQKMHAQAEMQKVMGGPDDNATASGAKPAP